MDSEVIKISRNEEEKIIALLDRMLILKEQNNKEVEASIDNGQILTTTSFNSLEEGMIVYHTLIFQELENARKNILNNSEMSPIIETFNNRGNIDESSPFYEPLTQENIEDIHINSKMEINKVIDFTDAKDVYSWLNELKNYVNNPQVTLLLDNSSMDYVSYLIRKLEENGYSDSVTDVNNLDDYYRKLISYQLRDLKTYGFFAYEYMLDYLEKKNKKTELPEIEKPISNVFQMEVASDASIDLVFKNMIEKKLALKQEVLCELNGILYSTKDCDTVEQLYQKYNFQNTKNNNNQSTLENDSTKELDVQLNQLLMEQQNLQKRLTALQLEKEGKIQAVNGKYQKIQSFADRKKDLDDKILEIYNEFIDDNAISLEEAKKTVERLNSFITNESIKNNPAIPMYNKALETHDENDIMQALEATEQLDDSHMYKKALKQSLNAMLNTYYPKKRKIDIGVVERFEETQKNIERLNSFITNETIKNNPAMPIYNRAIETHNRSDIEQAVEAVKQLDNSDMYKLPLLNSLSALVEEYYPDSVAESIDKIERLNNFITNDSIKNNEAMPFFNKAVETYNLADIMQAQEAAEQLDDSHMYKEPLLQALGAMRENIERLQTQRELSSSIQSINESIHKNQAEGINNTTSLYLKAIEDRNLEDIAIALKALKAPENQNNILKDSMINVLTSMLTLSSPKLTALKQQYKQLLQEEQEKLTITTPIIEKTEQELGKLDEQIKDVQQKIENNNVNQQRNLGQDNPTITLNPNLPAIFPQNKMLPGEPLGKDYYKEQDNSTINPIPNLAGSSSPDKMLPREPLEEDYYKRLENAAKEGPIFHDDDVDYDLTPRDEKPHIIKTIKKAPSKIINKIKDSSFVKLTSKVLDMMKKHKLVTVIATATMLGVAGIAKAFASESENLESTDNAVIEQSVSKMQESVNNTSSQNEQEKSVAETETAIETKSDEEKFNDELNEALSNILGGNTKVYTSVDRAVDNVEGKLPSQSNLDNSWSNATATTFYESESGKLQLLNREEAEKVIAEGGEVVARFDNNGTPIGYAKVGQEISQDNSTKSM